MPLTGFAFTSTALDFLPGLQPKIRKQIIKKAKALHLTPFPPGCKKLRGVETDDGQPIYRVRSGDFRILYVVKKDPAEVLILDIDYRKDIYKMPETNPKPADEMTMKESDFDNIMQSAMSVAAPPEKTTPPKASRAKGSKANR